MNGDVSSPGAQTGCRDRPGWAEAPEVCVSSACPTHPLRSLPGPLASLCLSSRSRGGGARLPKELPPPPRPSHILHAGPPPSLCPQLIRTLCPGLCFPPRTVRQHSVDGGAQPGPKPHTAQPSEFWIPLPSSLGFPASWGGGAIPAFAYLTVCRSL